MRCRDVEVYLKSSLKFIVYSTQAYVMLPVHPHAVREGLEHGALGGGERRLHLTAQAVQVAPPVEEGARRQAGDGARGDANPRPADEGTVTRVPVEPSGAGLDKACPARSQTGEGATAHAAP